MYIYICDADLIIPTSSTVRNDTVGLFTTQSSPNISSLRCGTRGHQFEAQTDGCWFHLGHLLVGGSLFRDTPFPLPILNLLTWCPLGPPLQIIQQEGLICLRNLFIYLFRRISSNYAVLDLESEDLLSVLQRDVCLCLRGWFSGIHLAACKIIAPNNTCDENLFNSTEVASKLK